MYHEVKVLRFHQIHLCVRRIFHIRLDTIDHNRL
nr:MAG TPA: hypothetical protein [Bacteriophage sp.]